MIKFNDSEKKCNNISHMPFYSWKNLSKDIKQAIN